MLDVWLDPDDHFSRAPNHFSQAPLHQPVIDPWGKAEAKKAGQNYGVAFL